MFADRNQLVFSATDLSSYAGCSQLSMLSRRAAFGGPQPPYYDDPSLELLWKRGLEHEQAFVGQLESAGRTVVRLARTDDDKSTRGWKKYAEQTTEAMQTGADVIYQGCLFDGTWLGLADFLLRVERPSGLGEWSYEVVDTKLAREAKGGALLQILLYADLLAQVQRVAPERVHIALGGPDGRMESFRVAGYQAYFRSIRRRFLQLMDSAPEAITPAPEPVEHCRVCAWSGVCADERREADHLSLVASISSRQRQALQHVGVNTLEALAELLAYPSLDGVSRTSFERVHAQARIQLEGRRADANVHELLEPITRGHGLAALPAPSPGDLYFDLEGDPFAHEIGIEYLFGVVDASGAYAPTWAFDRSSEKQAFERFIDDVMRRLERHPDLHIYHYNHYEITALAKLAGRYATREDDVDRLLRGEVFVDLYRVVKQGLRASVESYSIKKMEPFYEYTRAVDLREARSALAQMEAWLEVGGDVDSALLERIAGYNCDDCLSTRQLHAWLEGLRADLLKAGQDVPRPDPQDGEPTELLAKEDERVEELVARLIADVPADENDREPEQQARWLMAQLLEFHRREKKAFWREYFRCIALTEQELVEERNAIGGLQYVGEVGIEKRSTLHQYTYSPQEHRLRAGKTVADPATGGSPGSIEEIDDDTCTIIIKRATNSEVPHPSALVLKDHVDDRQQRESLMRMGEAVATHGLSDANPFGNVCDLLLRRPPHIADGSPLQRPNESVVDAAVRATRTLRGTVLPIQGPPGTGKTYTAARMIVAALHHGMRVGVTAQSHEVIGNLLIEVCAQAQAAGVAVAGMQKATVEQWCGAPEITATGSNDDVCQALASGEVLLAAGTAWLWSREEMGRSVDLLFIDEAGQFSLAGALAVAPAADSLILVGDPQQLEQPLQGSHPPGVHVSALEHLLEGHATVESGKGLFLGETWRLHPTICAFTSEIFYDSRLTPRPGLDRQEVRSRGMLNGNGLRFVSVQHEGNDTTSPEEVDVVAQLVDGLLSTKSTWIDRDGVEREIGVEDILVVAPYNDHVDTIAARLPTGIRVGTVDKFQGKQAPVVIYSMATSTPADAPRGMSFLYSPNRLNVATSRARCIAVVVASPALFTPECRTIAQMALANPFCRFAELSQMTSAPTPDVSPAAVVTYI